MVQEPSVEPKIFKWLQFLGRPILRVGMAVVCVIAPFHEGIDNSELLAIYAFTGTIYELRRREKLMEADKWPIKP